MQPADEVFEWGKRIDFYAVFLKKHSNRKHKGLNESDDISWGDQIHSWSSLIANL